MAQANAKLAQGPQPTQQQQPDLMSLYAQLYQRQQASEMFNRGLGGLTAAFSPLSQRNALMHEWDNMGGDPNALMNGIMSLQNFNYQQQQRQALAAAAPGLAKQLYGNNPTPEQLQMAQGLIASGQFGQIETSMVGGTDLDQRQYIQEQRANQQAGQPTVDFATWKAQHAAASAAGTKTAEDYAAEKSGAISTFPGLDRQYEKAEQDAEYLANNPDATVKAVRDWPSLTKGFSGQAAVKMGLVDQATADARAKLDELKDEQFTAGLRDTKNVRSLTEANKIGSSMTAIDNPQASPDFIKGEANRIRDTAQAARGNLIAAAGRQVPGKYSSLVDPGYLDKKSPLYNGATMQAPDTSIKSPAQVAAPAAPNQPAPALKPLTDAQKAQAQTLIARDGRGPVLQHLQQGGYDTSGL
jgi:hypothetical protein